MAFTEEQHSGNSFWKSFACAFEGVSHVFRTQRNFRIHLAMAGIVLLAGIGLGLSSQELAVLGLAIAFVIVAEMINTVAEVIVDLITPNHDPRAKIAKDVAAGAVLVSALSSVFVGIVVFGPHILKLVG